MINKLVAPFHEMLKKWQRAKLRRTMRGYQSLRKSGSIHRIAMVKQALTEHALSRVSRNLSGTIMGQGDGFGEAVIRQYLLVRIGGLNLNKALLVALGKKNGRVVFYLPKAWREILTQHGFKVAHLRSSLLWQLYVGAIFFYGILQIGKILLAGLFSRNDLWSLQKNHVFFADLGSGNLPQQINGSQSHDVISWYLQWLGRATGIESVHHTVRNAQPVRVGGVDVLPTVRVLPDLTGMRVVIRYALWGMRAIAIAAFDCLCGRWWHALLLNQAALAAQVRALPAGALAQEYLFHNSGWIYRPLWTYEAQQRGSEITFYFYSTNCENFKRPEGYPPLAYGWKAMTWPRYLVWDEYQADFVRRAVGAQAKLSIVGSIWFQSSAAEMPRLDRPGVGVFDVTPHRASRYCTLGMDMEFYTPAVANPFLEHVSEVLNKYRLLMLWKRKRQIGRLAHPHYGHLADRLVERNHVLLVDPDISAIRVIEASVAVVSMPFTSTALIAREMGKPSIYYDPTGLLQGDDRAAHGIPVLSGVEELAAWLSAHVTIQ